MTTLSVTHVVDPLAKSLYPAGLGVGTKGGMPKFGKYGALSYMKPQTATPVRMNAAPAPRENEWAHAIRALPTHLSSGRHEAAASAGANIFADSKMPAHEFLRGFHVQHGEYRTRLTRAASPRAGQLHVRGEIFHTPTGARVGNFRRTFTRQDGVPTVHHDVFEMNNEHRGSGFGTHFYTQMEQHYRKAGVKRVTMLANYKVGPYVWAMHGYDFAHPLERKHVVGEFNNWLADRGAPAFKRSGKLPSAHAIQHPIHSWEIATYQHNGERLGKEFLTRRGNTSYHAAKRLEPESEGYQVGAAYQRSHAQRTREATKTYLRKALPEHGDEEPPNPAAEGLERAMEPWHEDEAGEASAHEAVAKVVEEHHKEAAAPSEEPTAKSLGAKRTGAVIMLWLRPTDARLLAWPGAERPESLHLTLGYLGKAEELDERKRRAILALCRTWARRAPFATYISGIESFRGDTDGDGQDPVVARISPVLLGQAREGLVNQLRQIGVPVDMTYPDFKPHITVAYIPKDAEIPRFDVNVINVILDKMVVAFGEDKHIIRLERPRTGVSVDAEMTDTAYVPLTAQPRLWKAGGTWQCNAAWLTANCEEALLVKAIPRVAGVHPVGESGVVMNKPASPMPSKPRQPNAPSVRYKHPEHPQAPAAEAKVPRLAGGHIDWGSVPEGMAVWVTIKNEASPLYGKAVRIVRRGGGFAFAGGSAVVKQQAMLAGTTPSQLTEELHRQQGALGRMGMPKATLARREQMMKPLAERGRMAPRGNLTERETHELARVHAPVFPGAKPPEESEGRKKARKAAGSVSGRAVAGILRNRSRFISREAKSIRGNLARAAGMRVKDLRKRDLNNLAQGLLKEAASGSRLFKWNVSTEERTGFIRALSLAVGALSRESNEHVSAVTTHVALKAMGQETPAPGTQYAGVETQGETEAFGPDGKTVLPAGSEVATLTKRQAVSIVKRHEPGDITGIYEDIKKVMKENARAAAAREAAGPKTAGPSRGPAGEAKPKVGIDPELEARANALLRDMKSGDAINIELPKHDEEGTPTHKVHSRLISRFGTLVKNPKVRESIGRIGALAAEAERLEGAKEEANRVIAEMIRSGSSQSATTFAGTMAEEFAAFEKAWKGDMEGVDAARKGLEADPKFLAQVAGALGGNTVSRKVDSVMAFNGVVDKYFNRQVPLWSKENPYDVPEAQVGEGRRRRTVMPTDLSGEDLAQLSDAGEGLKHLGPYYQNEMGALFNHVTQGYFPDVPGMRLIDKNGNHLVRRYGATTAAYLFAAHLWRQHVLVRPRSASERARFRAGIDAIKAERPGTSEGQAIREYVRRQVDSFKAAREAIKNDTMNLRPIVEQDVTKAEADLVSRRQTIDKIVDETTKELKEATAKGDVPRATIAKKALARLHADAARAHIEGASTVGRALGALEGSALLYDAMGVVTSETRQRKHDVSMGMGADEEQARTVSKELFGHDDNVVNTGSPENPQWWVSTTVDDLMRTASRRVQATRSHDEDLWKERTKMFVPHGQAEAFSGGSKHALETEPEKADWQDEKSGEWFRRPENLHPDVVNHLRDGAAIKVGQANALDYLARAKSAHLDHLYGMGKTVIGQGHLFREIEEKRRAGTPFRGLIVAQDPTPWTAGPQSAWAGVLDPKDIPMHYATKVTGTGESARTTYDPGATKKFLANPHGVMVVSAADARRADFQDALRGYDEDGETKVHHVLLDEPHRFLMNPRGNEQYGSVGRWLFSGKGAISHPAVEADEEKGVEGRPQGAHVIMATATPADATHPQNVHRIFQPIARMRGRTLGTLANFRESMRGIGTQSGATEARRQQFIHDAVGDMQVSDPTVGYPFPFEQYDRQFDLTAPQIRSMNYWQTDEAKPAVLKDIGVTAAGRTLIEKGTPGTAAYRALDPDARERWVLRLKNMVDGQVRARQRDAQYGVPTESDPNTTRLEDVNPGAKTHMDEWKKTFREWEIAKSEAERAGKEPPPPPKFSVFTWDSPHQATAWYHMLNRAFPGRVVYAAHATCGDYHGRPRDKEGKVYPLPAHTPHPSSPGERVSAEQKARDARDADIERYRKGVNKKGEPYVAAILDSLSKEAISIGELDDTLLAGVPLTHAIFPGEQPGPDVQTFGQAIGRGTRNRQGRKYRVGFMMPRGNTEQGIWAGAKHQIAASRSVMPAATSLFDELLKSHRRQKTFVRVNWTPVKRDSPAILTMTPRRPVLASA